MSRIPLALLLLLALFGRISTARAEDIQLMPPDKAAQIVASGAPAAWKVSGKLYFAIPKACLGRPMLWASSISEAPAGVDCAGAPLDTHVVRWDRVDDVILLRDLSFHKRVAPSPVRSATAKGGAGELAPPVETAVEVSSLPPVIASFPVLDTTDSGVVTIDVTGMIAGDTPEFSPRSELSDAGVTVDRLDAGRTFVDSAKTFPQNLDVRSLLTYTVKSGTQAPYGISSVSVVVHHSINLLPDHPMRPRYFNPSVGYFTTAFEEYGGGDRSATRRLIRRFRLEQSDPSLPLSRPVKPIVYTIGREVPVQWRPYIREGIKDWAPAFEAAGFKDAIEVRDAPSAQEDPDWDPDDTRNTMVRWIATQTEDAEGLDIYDPRSGEILSASITLNDGLLRLGQDWYFAECSGVDPRARHLPLPADLTGEILRCIVSHEVGHTLGLRHNDRASSAFTVAQLRSPLFTAKHGDVASIMSYGRFNYVAQPGDGVTNLIPRIGPYDEFAIRWGYTPTSAATPEEERPILDRMATIQSSQPWLRFGGEDMAAQFDPSTDEETIGSDPIAATALGLKNLDRAAGYLAHASDLWDSAGPSPADEYQTLLFHRASWVGSVIKLVGGISESGTRGRYAGARFTPVAGATQRRAVQFLCNSVFSTPTHLVRPELLARMPGAFVTDPIRRQQIDLLTQLMAPARSRDISQTEAVYPRTSYTLIQFMEDLRHGLWSELGSRRPVIDSYRRDLQRTYLGLLRKQLDSSTDTSATPAQQDDPETADDDLNDDSDDSDMPDAPLADTDFGAVARASLQTLATSIDHAMPRASDPSTKLHLRDCSRQIDALLHDD